MLRIEMDFKNEIKNLKTDMVNSMEDLKQTMIDQINKNKT